MNLKKAFQLITILMFVLMTGLWQRLRLFLTLVFLKSYNKFKGIKIPKEAAS